MGVSMIVDEQRESGHICDVDERVPTFVSDSIVTNVDHGRDEQWIVLELFLGELVSAQELVCLQRERQ